MKLKKIAKTMPKLWAEFTVPNRYTYNTYIINNKGVKIPTVHTNTEVFTADAFKTFLLTSYGSWKFDSLKHIVKDTHVTEDDSLLDRLNKCTAAFLVKYGADLGRIYTGLLLEYDPITNYYKYSDITDTPHGSILNDSLDNNKGKDYTATFDADEVLESSSLNEKQTAGLEYNYRSKEHYEDYNTNTFEHTFGNIGVMTPADALTGDMQMRLTYMFMDIVLKMYVTDFLHL